MVKNNIDGWMSEEELEWLYSLAQQVNSIAEIGSWKGRSTFALLSGCKGDVYAIDTFKGSIDELDTNHKEANEKDIYAAFIKNVGHFSNLSVVKSDSVEAADLVPDVDVVFIDGSHDYESVLADIRAWKPKAKRLLCGHDFNWTDVEAAVLEELGSIELGPGSIWYKHMGSRFEDLPRLVVCLPGSNFSGKWLAAWDALHAELLLQYRVTRIYGEGNNIYEVRNDCVEKIANVCSKDEPEFILWIDSDNVVDYQGFLALRNGLKSIPEADIVGAWYLMQMHHGEKPLITAGVGNDRPTIDIIREAAGRLMGMEYIGFGFLLMRYSVIDRLGLRCFNPILRDDGEFETDDVSFCLRAKKMGMEIFIHSAVHSPHLKLQPIPLSVRSESAKIILPFNERSLVS